MTSKKRQRAREGLRVDWAKGVAEALKLGFDQGWNACQNAHAERYVLGSPIEENRYFIGKNPFDGPRWKVAVPIPRSGGIFAREAVRHGEQGFVEFLKVPMGIAYNETNISWYNITPDHYVKPVAFGLDGIVDAVQSVCDGIAYIMGWPFGRTLEEVTERATDKPEIRQMQHSMKKLVAMRDRVCAALEVGPWDPRNIQTQKRTALATR